MGFRNAFISLLLPIVTTGALVAQPNNYGIPMITNYPHSITGGSEQNWCATQDARGIMYFGNNNKGVLEYDGMEWRSIPVPNNSIIRSMVTGADGVVYVGADSEFGFLAPDAIGNMHYISRSDTIDQEQYPFSEVWRIYYHEELVYYCTFPWIFIYNRSLDQLNIVKTSEYAFFSHMIDDHLYVSDWGSGLMKLEGKEFVPIKGGALFKEKLVTGMVKYDESKLVVGTANHGVFLFNVITGTVDPGFPDADLQEHLKNGIVTYLSPFNQDFVVSSLYNGLAIIDRNGSAREIIGESEGLIDQDITYAYSNEQLKGSSPLWITNWMGVSKLEIYNPFRQFTEAAGFEGFITDIARFDGKLFISTSSGLYFKSSNATSTYFQRIPQTRDKDIRSLHVFNPNPEASPARRVELLLASSEFVTYIVDKQMVVSTLMDKVMNPHKGLQERAEYAGRSLAQDPKNPDIIYTGRAELVQMQYTRGRWKELMRVSDLSGQDRLERIQIDRYNYVWTNTESKVIRIDITQSNDFILKFFDDENGLPTADKNKVFIDPDSDEVLLGTTDGFYRYNYFRNTIYRDTIYNRVLPQGKNLIMDFIRDREGDYWFSFENEFTGWTELVARKEGDLMRVIQLESFKRLPNSSTDVFYSDPEGGVWFGKSNELYHFDKRFSRVDSLTFQTLVRSVTINNDSILFYGTNFIKDPNGKGFKINQQQDESTRPQISHRYNNIEFHWASPFFEQEDELKYSYMLEGFDDHWSEWSNAAYKDFTNLNFGDYTIHVKAMNVYGDESLPATYSFEILRPWYATYLAILAYILLSGLLVYVIIKLYTRRLKQENIRLEGIIEERTAEIRKQKEELTDSIEYASRIQRALLPPQKLLDEHDMEHFILFRPRDIVSGDFYWIGQKHDKLIIVASDCTGHGVPGAFMSMLGMTFLDEIVIKSEITQTNEILDQLRQHVITSLRQSGKSVEESTKDGMDLTMVSIDINTREIQFSGAYNPLYLVRKLTPAEKASLSRGEDLDTPRGSIHDDRNLLLQLRADQMPIGISEKTQPFTATSVKDEGFSIYMFSDGYLDQFGGPKGKKFMSKNFKKLILELQSTPIKEQGAALEKVLLGWMGEISQIDDILVMGLRMNEH